MKKRFWPLIGLGILAAVAVAFGLFTWLVMLLWNNVLAAVVHVGVITFWQAAGLLLLSKILFGFGGGHFKGHRSRKDMAWRREMMNKWQNMTPEERKKFKEGFRERCRGDWYGGRGWQGDFNRQEEKKDEGGMI